MPTSFRSAPAALAACALVLAAALSLAGAPPARASTGPPAPGLYEGEGDAGIFVFGPVRVFFELTHDYRIRDFQCTCALGVEWWVIRHPADDGAPLLGSVSGLDASARADGLLVAFFQGRWSSPTSVEGDAVVYLWGVPTLFLWRAHHVAGTYD